MLLEQPLLILYNIIYNLDERSIRNLSKTCKYFHQLTKNILGCIILGLSEVCVMGNLEVVKYLVLQGGDVTAQNNYAVRHASENGHLEVVKYLVSEGADVTAWCNWAVRWASHNGHLEVVEYLVSQGADITADNNYAVRWASHNGHLEVVKYLVSQGADIISANRWARLRDQEVLKYLSQGII